MPTTSTSGADASSESIEAFYKRLAGRVEGFVSGSNDALSALCNTAALISGELRARRGESATNWTGFYLSRPVGAAKSAERALVLGPFMGKPAVVFIPYKKGVCGTAAAERKTQLVKDVHKHPNHIACDSASQSEIVVPIFDAGGALRGVLDMDCPKVAGFDAADRTGLEAICAILGKRCDWALCEIPYKATKTEKECKS